MAKERLRKLETSLASGVLDTQLPTKTPITDLVNAYAGHIRTTKTKNSIKVDTWYLRSIFGPTCPALEGIEERKWKKTMEKVAFQQALLPYFSLDKKAFRMW